MLKSRRVWAIGLPLAAVLAAVLVIALRLRGAGEQPQPARVGEVDTMVETVRLRDFPLTREVPGTVVAIQHAELSPKVMGHIAAVYVHEGDRVVKGQLLARLEASDLKAGVRQAGAGLQNAKAAYAQSKTALAMQQTQSSVTIQQAEAALAQAKAQLAKAQQGPRPEQVLQADEAERRAKAGHEQAAAGLALVKEGARAQQKRQAEQAVLAARQQVAQAEAGVAAAQAGLDSAQADYTRMNNLYAQDIVSKQSLEHMSARLEAARQGVRQAEAAREAAKAGLEMARENASMVNEGARTQEIIAAEKQVEQARAGYEQAKQEALMAHQGGRWEDIKTAEEGVRQAEAALRAARAAQGRDDVSARDVQRAGAGISQAQAALAGAETMAGYANIYAPFNGVITARKADPGSLAMPQMPILAIDDDSQYQLVASVPEKIAAGLARGDVAGVQLEALKRTVTASVVEIVPAADPASRTLTVKANLPSTPGLQSGIFGRIAFTTGKESLLTIPAAALLTRNGLTGIYVVDEAGQARYTLVSAGRRLGDRLEVLSGLQAGQRVITARVDEIVPGERVRMEGATL